MMCKPLMKLGFEYNKEWKFIRKSNGFTEYISLDQSQWQDNVIRVYFSNGEKSVGAKRLIEKKPMLGLNFMMRSL